MSNKIQVVIADANPSTLNHTLTLIGLDERFDILGEAHDLLSLFSAVEAKPDVILIDVNVDGMRGVDAAESISRKFPFIPIIMTSAQLDAETMRRAMLAGSREFLPKDASSDFLKETIVRVCQIESEKKEQILSALQVEQDQDKQIDTKVITFLSGKGGVGKSALAVNLAIALAQYQKKVAIIDLDLMFGDCSVLLDLSPQRALNHLVEDGNFEEEVLHNYLTPHPIGLNLLAAPFKPEQADFITGWHVEQILQTLKGKYEYIIFDTGNNFHETVLTSLDHSTEIFLVHMPTISSLKATKSLIELLLSLNYQSEKIKLVQNRTSKGQEVKNKYVLETLNRPIFAEFSDDPKMFHAGNEGSPILLSYPNRKIADQFYYLAESLIGEVAPQPKRKWFQLFKREGK